MKKSFFIFLIVFGVILLLRFGLGGGEDDWICVDGQWVEHGHPSAPKPIDNCP